ncbi:DUF3035 domain-containing protein [Azospirillum sp. SYSU D00513]|uniref:DUF3035 domain-containing protein n=1 Tax=Azospirillum sp. SYSU D00513 TaxID=2812561 RepID=UPI0032B5687D
MIDILSASPTSRRSARPILGPLSGLALAALAVTGCSDIRQSIGLDRNTPDEFTVVSRAPLSMPPSMSLPAPRPGAARPQDAHTAQMAAASVFGGASRGTVTGTAGESALVAQAATKGIDPDIRAKVDQETTALISADKRWVDRLLFWQTQEPPHSIVDPAKERERLRAAAAEGKALNDGAVPTIERRRKAPLEGLF